MQIAGAFHTRSTPPFLLKGAKGFTLVELVVVIVLLGITAVTLTTLITGSVRGYLDTANRQDSAASARVALDRIGRELREAMPQSVRVSSDNKCIQFLPVVTSFTYTTLNSGDTSVQVVEPPGGYSPPPGNFFAAVYPLNAGELYSSQAMKSVAFNNVTSGLRTLTLGSAFTTPYPRNGAGQRLYIVSLPVNYCFTGATLVRAVDNALSPTQTSAGALTNAFVLADHMDDTASSFGNTGSTWQSNSLVKIVLAISRNNETLSLDHEVWIRNVQ